MSQGELLFGYSEADITPEGPVTTVGFGRGDEMSRGVLHSLSAQIAVWRLGNDVCCLAAIDHIGFSKKHSNALRDGIGAALGVPREKVMLCFSHTHAGPNDSVEAAWFSAARAKIERAAGTAHAAMGPVRAAWGNAAGDIGLNRRAESERLDKRIGILLLSDSETNAPRLLLLRLTAHANVLKADNYFISPDYFGAVRDTLGEKYGCPVMATQGASGDVSPKYFRSRLTPPDAADARFVRAETALSDMAQAVLNCAGPVIDALSPQKVRRLAMGSRTITLMADVPDEARALAVAREAQTLCGIDPAGWLFEVKRLNEAGIRAQREDVEAQFFRLGDGCLCGVPNEIMCDFSLRAAHILRDEFFYFGGYTNGCTGYFPTEAEFDKGGYEVYWSMLVYYIYFDRVFPLRRETASELVDFVAKSAPDFDARGMT